MKGLFNHIKELFKEPDPMRFAAASTPMPNWFGELEKHPVKQKSGPVLVNQATNTFEFGRVDIEIEPTLTASDIKGLKERGYDPNNPAYAKAKEYFSKMPYCTKEDLAANSGGQDFEPISKHTAKDVLAAFRAFLIQKPSF